MEGHQPWWHQAGEGQLKGPSVASKTCRRGLFQNQPPGGIYGNNPKSREKDGA